MTKAINQLLGWKPVKSLAPLAIASRPAPVYEQGYVEFPIVFKTQFVVSGEN